jgi:hypothetical protein
LIEEYTDGAATTNGNAALSGFGIRHAIKKA